MLGVFQYSFSLTFWLNHAHPQREDYFSRPLPLAVTIWLSVVPKMSVIGISSVLGPSGQGCIPFSAFSSLPIGFYINRVLVDSVEAFTHLFNQHNKTRK